MRMAKMAGKCAAVLSAMAIAGSTAAVTVSAAGVTLPAATVAAAEYAWNITETSPDQFVKMNSQFTVSVEVGSWVQNPTYQWQVSPYGKGMADSSWSNISGATSGTLRGTMTSQYNGAHIRCVVTDKTRNIVDVSDVRTVWSVEAAAKLGTAKKITSGTYSGYYQIPLTISGLYKNSIAGFNPEFIADPNAVEDMKWEYNSKLTEKGDFMDDFDVFEQENVATDSGYEKVSGKWMLNHLTLFTPTTLGSDNTLGFLYVKLKSGVSSAKVTMQQRDDNYASLFGDNFEGNLIYGMSYTGATVSASSSSTAVPKINNIEYNTNYHQFRIYWDAVPNAQAYGIAYYAAGKWRAYGSNLSASTLSWTSPKLTAGKSYKLTVVAKVDGVWGTSAAVGKAVTVTVK